MGQPACAFDDITNEPSLWVGTENGNKRIQAEQYIIDNLVSNESNGALSARQGMILKEMIDSIGSSSGGVNVVDNLNSNSPISALSARQGKILNDKIVNHANNQTEEKHIEFATQAPVDFTNTGVVFLRKDGVIDAPEENLISEKIEDLFQLTPSIVKFKVNKKYRAWQGVTAHSGRVYVASDRNEAFGLENIISVYTLNGEFLFEKRNAYTGLDPQNKFMSFGDINIIDGVLYATVYNYNAGGSPLISRVIEFSIDSLEVIGEHEIGGNVAESVTKHDNFFWVAYHDIKAVRKFNSSFSLMGEYSLEIPESPQGFSQGSLWEGEYYYILLHGCNSIGDSDSHSELRKYQFNGTAFTFIESIEPPTTGSGQGLTKYNNYYFWNDRPSNSIIITKSLYSGKIYAEMSPLTSEQTIDIPLINGFERWDISRTAQATLYNGVVYLTGMIKNPNGNSINADENIFPFLMPVQLSASTSKNFSCLTNKGIIRVAIANKNDGLNARKVVLGERDTPITGVTWISLEGISYPLIV